MKYLSTIFILILSILSSCVKQDLDILGGNIVYFNVTDYFVEVTGTRGTPITQSSDIPNIGVFAYYTGNGSSNNWSNNGSTATPNFLNNVKISNISNVWSADNKIYWQQSSNANATFFAYSPFANLSSNGIEITNTTGVPTLKYTVPSICANQPDLMIAVPQFDKNMSNTSGTVGLPMKHALACVGFNIKGNGETISKIAIKGVSMSATLSLDGTSIVWSSHSNATNTEYSAGIKNNLTAGSTTSNAINEDGYMMMIPQSLNSSSKLVVTVADQEKEISLSGFNWEAGKKYTYNINVQETIDFVEINGIKWAKGNLVADGKGGCKIGDPEDNGLYFQFGSLIGWSGGKNGDGTGLGTNNSSPALRVIVNNSGSGPAVNSTNWVAQENVTYFKSTYGENIPLTPNGAIGDPCRHYLGSSWRLPSQEMLIALFENKGSIWGYSWNSFNYWSTSKVNNTNNLYAIYNNGAITLKLAACGKRNADGILENVAIEGNYWGGTIVVGLLNWGRSTIFNSQNVYPVNRTILSNALTVRCIKE